MIRTEPLKIITSRTYVQRWAGSYTFISCAYWGHQYFRALQAVLGVHFDHTLFIHEQGVVAFYLDEHELQTLGRHLNSVTKENPEIGRQWLRVVKENTDSLIMVMDELKGQVPTWEQYQRFRQFFDRHLPYHVYMKEVIDYIDPAVLEPLLPVFEDARRYSEPVYSETERFFRSVMQAVGHEEDRSADELTCLTQPEFEAYLQRKTLPAAKTLAERYVGSVLWFDNDQLTILPVNQIPAVRAAISQGLSHFREHLRGGASYYTSEVKEKVSKSYSQQTQDEVGILRGKVAHPGQARGIVRVVLDPYKVGEFHPGDILVTGMTRPEFLPIMKKAAAIVTDAGGVLSHAAIAARELQIPCVIGTEVATQLLKDGDFVHVDATAGIVRTIRD